MNRPPDVLWFPECRQASLPQVGGKNASLGEMLAAGIRVPPGFAITTNAYARFLAWSNLASEIEHLLVQVDVHDVLALEEASRALRELIAGSPLPGDLAPAIRSAYQRLEDETQTSDLAVAVRSSATTEDLPGASFAGQHETFLWVRGADPVAQHVQRCWASLFTPRAIAYRHEMGVPHEKSLISVGVQKMVNARAAGVMFTLHPVTGDASQVVIEASWGLGESVVKGEVSPDRFYVDKVTLNILDRTVSPKTLEYRVDDRSGGVVPAEVPPERESRCCLTEAEVRELARLGKRIERHYGRPQDIEFAVEGQIVEHDSPEELTPQSAVHLHPGRAWSLLAEAPDWAGPLQETEPELTTVFIVQSRPETVWSQRQTKPIMKPQATAQDYVLAGLLQRLRPLPAQ